MEIQDNITPGKPRQKRLKQATSFLEAGILKIFKIKEDRGIDENSDSKTGRFLNTVEKKMFSAVDALEERNSDSFREELTSKIQDLSLDELSIDYSRIKQIQGFFELVLDERTGKEEKIINIELKHKEARISTYLDIFSDFGVEFEEDNQKLIEKINTFFFWDSSLESFLQTEIIELTKTYTSQKFNTIANIIQVLQSPKKG